MQFLWIALFTYPYIDQNSVSFIPYTTDRILDQRLKVTRSRKWAHSSAAKEAFIWWGFLFRECVSRVRMFSCMGLTVKWIHMRRTHLMAYSFGRETAIITHPRSFFPHDLVVCLIHDKNTQAGMSDAAATLPGSRDLHSQSRPHRTRRPEYMRCWKTFSELPLYRREFPCRSSVCRVKNPIFLVKLNGTRCEWGGQSVEVQFLFLFPRVQLTSWAITSRVECDFWLWRHLKDRTRQFRIPL